jgi:hypothetical protein
MISKSVYQLFMLLFTLLFSLNLSAAPSREQLLDQMINVYGGVAALEKLNEPYHQLWDVDAVARNKKGTDQRDIALPGDLSTVLTYPDRKENRILVGDQGKVAYNNGNHIKAEGPRLNAMRLQRMRLYNPLLLRNRAADITYIEHNGKYRLTLGEDDITTDYYVEPESHLIALVIGTLHMNGMSMAFRTEYSDYRKVEGVMLPHREVKYAGAVKTAIVTLRETRFGSNK